jgi:hypothetical protein
MAPMAGAISARSRCVSAQIRTSGKILAARCSPAVSTETVHGA